MKLSFRLSNTIVKKPIIVISILIKSKNDLLYLTDFEVENEIRWLNINAIKCFCTNKKI